MLAHETAWRISRRELIFLPAGLVPAVAAGQPIRFAIITDTHYADRPAAAGRHYGLALQKMHRCVTLLENLHARFLVELGDFKDQAAKPSEETTLAYLRSVEAAFARFRGDRFHVLGNHDMDSISKQQFQSVVSNTGIGRGRTWFSWDGGFCHFTVLDANFRSDGAAYDKGNFDWQDANIPGPQLEWLAADLKRAQRPAMVFVHQRLDEGGATSIANRKAVRQVLADSRKVSVVFQGHHHAGDFQIIDGIPYYTLVSAVESPDPADSTCAVVELLPKGAIQITGYQRAVSRRLAGR